MRGKINMICEEWCMEINFATLERLYWPFQRASTVLIFTLIYDDIVSWTYYQCYRLVNK